MNEYYLVMTDLMASTFPTKVMTDIIIIKEKNNQRLLCGISLRELCSTNEAFAYKMVKNYQSWHESNTLLTILNLAKAKGRRMSRTVENQPYH